eukprot:jgi/Galph1/993/GphlegSOOS_G5757.1
MFVCSSGSKQVFRRTTHWLTKQLVVTSFPSCIDRKTLTIIYGNKFRYCKISPRQYCCSTDVPLQPKENSDLRETFATPSGQEPAFLLRARLLAEKAASDLNLSIQKVHWTGGKLVVYIGREDAEEGPTVNDCSSLSRALSKLLDEEDLIPLSYHLEVSSPGISNVLQYDKDFTVFKGFPVKVITYEAYKGKTLLTGRLIGRNIEQVLVNCGGRIKRIPRSLVKQVALIESKQTE